MEGRSAAAVQALWRASGVRGNRLRRGGDEGVVDLAGADGGRTALQAGGVALESRPLLDRAELQAPADVGAEVEVGRAEP
jgi:hypothetical protein